MELELGLKITKTIDDNASTSQYQFIKDIGPIFQSRETNTMFILTAHLKGYKKEAIDIKISKDGSKISISGEKPIQEMVMMGWVMHKKMVNVKGFNKVFKIPNGVNLDKIKANYNEEEWMLNVVMPKLVKGICGLKIGEVNEQEFDKGRLELDKNKNVNDHVSSSFEDTSLKGSKDSEFKHMKEGENIMEKMIDDSNKEINEDTIHKEVEESKLRNGESVGENIGKEEYEVMKKLELDQSVGEFIAKKIKDTNHDKESKDQKFDNTSFDKKRFDDVNRDITRGIIKNENEESKLRIEDGKLNEQESKPKMEIKDGEQECVRENDVKEGIDDAMITINKELPKNLPKSTHEESEGLNIKNMQETKDVKEEKVVKEIEYYVEKGEDGRNKRKVAAATIDGSKGFNVAKKEEQKEVMEETLVDSESLMENVEREESKEEDKIEYGIIGKLKGEGSKKIDVDTFEGDTTRDKIEKEIRNKKVDCIDELSEKENVNIGIFDGRKTQNFQDIDQTEDCAKIEKCLHRDNGEKYEKIQNTDGFKKNITKEKDKYDLQEEMSKRRLEESKAIKQDFSMKILDSPNNTKMKKLKDEGNFRKETSNGRSQESKTSIEDFSVKMLDSQDDTRMEKTTEEMNKGSSQESKRAKENFPIKMLNPQDDARDGLKETTEQKIKEIRGSIDIESTKVVSFVKKKGNGQKYENIQVDANEDLKNDITNDTTQKESQEEPKILLKVKDQQCLQEQISKERSQESKVAKEDFPMKMSDSPYDPRVGLKKEIEEKLKVIKQSINQESEKVVTFKKKNIVEEKNDNTQVEPNGGLRNEITKTTTQRESEQEPKILIKAKDKKCLQEEMSNDRSQESKDAKENFSMKMLDSHDDTKMEKIKEMSERSSQESKTTYEDFSKNFFDSARDTNIEKIKDERYVQEEMSKGKSQENKAARDMSKGRLQEDFPMKMLDSLDDTKKEKIKEDMSKRKSQDKKSAEEYFPISILDSSVDAIEGLKETINEKIEVTRGSIKEKNAKIVSFEKKKVMEEKNHKTQVEANGGLSNDITMDTTQKESEEEPKILIKAKDQQCMQEKMSKGISQESKDAKEGFLMKMIDSDDDSKERSRETIEKKLKEEMSEGRSHKSNAAKEDFPKKMFVLLDDTRMEEIKDECCLQEEMSKGGSQEIKVSQEDFPIKILDSLNETRMEKIKDECKFQEEMKKGISQENKVAKEDFPTKMIDSPNDAREGLKEATKEKTKVTRWDMNEESEQVVSLDSPDDAREQLKETTNEKIKVIRDTINKESAKVVSIVEKKVKRQKNENEKTEVEKSEGLRNDITKDTIQKESNKKPKILQQCLQEEISKRRSQESSVAKEDFSMKMLDSLDDAREGLKETAEEKVKVNRETINEKSEKVVSFVKKKIKGEKNEKTQVEVNESSTNDITKDTTQKESEEQPKIILKAKDQQNLQEEMSKGRNVESTSAEEFPMQIEEDSFVKRKGKEMFFNESTIKEELQGCEVERVGQNLFNVPNEKHPKFSTIVSKGFKEFEYNGNAKDNNHKTNFESKETHESKDESMKQDILNPKKQKEVGEQVVKPLLSPKQCEVEEKDKLLLCKASLELLQREDPTKDMQNLIEMKPKQRETLKPEIFEDVSQIVEREEYKTTQNVNGDKLKKQGEIIYDGDIEKVDDDKEKRNHETMKTINEKVHPIKYEIDEKEKECLEASLNNNDNAQMESQRPLEQNDYGTQEIKAPKIAPFEGANQQSINEEKRKIEHVIEAIKESPKINNEESEGNDDSFKPHVLEEALDECELKGAKNLIENSGQQYVHYKKTYQTPKGVEENDLNKKEETLIKKVEKKKTNESTKPKLEYEIPKVEEVEEEEEEEKEEERNIHVLEATISKEEDKVEQKGLNKFAPLKEPFHSLDEVAQQSKLSNSSCTQQFEVEREEEKTKKKDSKIDIQESTKIETGQEVEQCTTNKDEEAKHGIEEIDESYDEVLEEQKECKDETSEGKKDNPKISKKLLVPLVIAGFVTLVVFFVRLRRARKRYNVR
uniref:Golgin subfamily B member 1-like isoform X1 n=1 Tax=Cicer arietinum TaxID=3827 RepID=A0A1S2Z740_CICAR|nr:golgin subfamily B member 1-like isoform X1 [Cicer arietinum]